MSHEEEDDIIILSVTLPGGCAAPLDNLVAAGSYGSSREDVALHFICRALGVDPRPELPPAPVEAPTDEELGDGSEAAAAMAPESGPAEGDK